MTLGLPVLHIVGSVSEGLVARFTLVRFLSGVNTIASLETEGVGEEFVADWTLMLLLVGIVSTIITVIRHTPVTLQLSLRMRRLC